MRASSAFGGFREVGSCRQALWRGRAAGGAAARWRRAVDAARDRARAPARGGRRCPAL